MGRLELYISRERYSLFSTEIYEHLQQSEKALASSTEGVSSGN
jgi:hypothetical protein